MGAYLSYVNFIEAINIAADAMSVFDYPQLKFKN